MATNRRRRNQKHELAGRKVIINDDAELHAGEEATIVDAEQRIDGVYYHLTVTSAGANVVLPDRFVTLQVAAQLLLLHEHSQVMEYRALVSNLGLFSTDATGAFEIHGDQFIASFDADDTFGIPMLLCTPLDNAVVSKFMPCSRSH